VEGCRDRLGLPGASRSFGHVLKGVLREKRFYQKVRYGRLAQAWENVVGEEIFRLTRITGYLDGKLVIEVASSALLQELSGFMKPLLLEKLRAEQGAQDVVSLEFRLGTQAPR